jgi:hypothetical protein
MKQKKCILWLRQFFITLSNVINTIFGVLLKYDSND